MIQTEISQYIAELNRIYKAENATEHSYRPALKSLLEKLTSGLTITNEPKRIACGAPDYIVTRGEIPVGYIEAKDIGVNLNDKAHKTQFDRYKQSLNNLIITDYISFYHFENGEPVASVAIAKIGKNGIEPNAEQFEKFETLIRYFFGYDGQTIRSSEQLSKVMAGKARLMAKTIENSFNAGDNESDTSIYGQMKGFREALIPNITNQEFSDVYAQTIAYGMFAARLNSDPAAIFNRSAAANLIPHSNPFLRKLFQYIAGFDLDERIRWVVDDLAGLFNHVDISAIFQEFDKSEHDPMIHFYETFLSHYDPVLRKSRGVWYTPQPIVKFIVRAIDDILISDFSIPEGLADATKVKRKQQIRQTDGVIREEEREYHKVQILEPAVGTGTFLTEIIQNIYSRFKDMQGVWQSYASNHLIPRINGFEILMASYAMAHLKMDMVLKQTGYKHSGNERFKIFLTNSLDEARAKSEIPFVQWLANEANEANHIKRDVPVMVVVGNPPYSVSTQNKQSFVNDLLNVYKEGIKERNIQPLSDDYIKFIRLGQRYVEENREGILAYISNNSFIDGLIHRQMRKNLLTVFDKIYILDLHGSAKKKETSPDGSRDENVFDIQQGTSINIFVKTRKDKGINPLAVVYHADLFGKRSDKYNFLLNNTLQSVKWKQLKCDDDNYFFVPKDFSLLDEYKKGFKIDELFPISTSGVKTHNDDSLVSFLPFSNNNRLYTYRPFDNRFICYDLNKVQRHRCHVMKHFINEENIGLIIGRQGQAVGSMPWNLSFLTKQIADTNIYYRGGGIVFPLYLYPKTDKLFTDETETTRKSNFHKEIIKNISKCIKLRFTEEKEETENTFAPIDVLDYIYAVLHSPKYRERYKEFLKIDFPRVPYPKNAGQFWQLVSLGAKLRCLHLMNNIELEKSIAVFPIAGSNEVETIKYIDNKVFINDTQYFDNVPSEAWNFYIGGYQPAQKWLKDRKGRTLEYDDIVHYRKIICVLKETVDIMQIIDI